MSFEILTVMNVSISSMPVQYKLSTSSLLIQGGKLELKKNILLSVSLRNLIIAFANALKLQIIILLEIYYFIPQNNLCKCPFLMPRIKTISNIGCSI